MVDSIIDSFDTWTDAQGIKSKGRVKSIDNISLEGIARLRELILELAVIGKLISQDPNDEPISYSLENIAAEKAKLIKKKEIKAAKVALERDMPDVNLNAPNGWSVPMITELIVNSSDHIVDGPFGSKLKATEYVSEGIPIIRIQNIDRNIFKNNGLQYISEIKAEELNRHNYTSGDIVINKLGDPTGKACEIPKELPDGIIVADIVRIRLNRELYDQQYILYALNSPFVAYQFKGLAKGVTRQRVNLSQVRAIRIPLPPFEEQKRIVAKVDELMALCDKLEADQTNNLKTHELLVETLLGTLTQAKDANELRVAWERMEAYFDTLFCTEDSIEQLKQTILQLAVMGKLVKQDPNDEPASKLLEKIEAEKAQLLKEKKIKKEKPLPKLTPNEIPFNSPNGWEFERLGNLANRIGSGSTPRGGRSAYTNEGYIFLRSQNIWNHGLELSDVAFIPEETHEKMKNTKVYPKDILLNITGGSLGRSTIFPDSINEANVSQHVTIIRPTEIQTRYFLHLCILSPYIQSLIWGRQVGMAREGLSKKVLELFEFPVPPLKEQQRIVKKVAELFTLCDNLKEKIQNSQKIKNNLSKTIVEKALK